MSKKLCCLINPTRLTIGDEDNMNLLCEDCYEKWLEGPELNTPNYKSSSSPIAEASDLKSDK